MGDLAVTWWGHASATVELGQVRVAVDPLLVDQLFHLRRYGVSPNPAAYDADVIVISHLHADHLHVPSLKGFPGDLPIVIPAGAESLLGQLNPSRLVPVRPGDVLDVAGTRITVLPATHDGHRGPFTRTKAPALGFRIEGDGRSMWFPGDTELRNDMTAVDPVDLALAPVGGWGPTLGAGHMDPVAAATAVKRVGARYAVPVHWGTFWPVGLHRLDRRTHHRLFATPGERFASAVAEAGAGAEVVPALHGERVEL